MSNISDKIAGSFIGVILGDTLGMPVETKPHEWIMLLNEGRGITTFEPSMSGHFRSYAAGDTTDDWQLTRAVIRSLIRTQGRFDLVDCAQEHVREWEPDTTTWGKTTHAAIADIKDGLRDPLTPLPSPEGKAGLGAGVVMKVAGLAAAHALDIRSTPLDLGRDCMALGSLTHACPIASTTAYAVAEVIRSRLLGLRIDLNAIAETCLALDPDPEFPDLLRRLPLLNAEQRRELPYHKFSAIYCASFSIATASAHGDDFKTGVLEAVNAGGDADTNASVVGAIIGAGIGYAAVPDEWKLFRPEYAQASDLAYHLTQAAA